MRYHLAQTVAHVTKALGGVQPGEQQPLKVIDRSFSS
jgi:hypothetical protein